MILAVISVTSPGLAQNGQRNASCGEGALSGSLQTESMLSGVGVDPVFLPPEFFAGSLAGGVERVSLLPFTNRERVLIITDGNIRHGVGLRSQGVRQKSTIDSIAYRRRQYRVIQRQSSQD